MKKYIHVLCAALTCVVLYTSCMNSDDNSSAVVYDDMAITGFRLTSINRLVHSTTKAGKDTVIKKTLANPVPFTINQETYEIYNVDSLPYGCDTKRVLATISSKNNGQIMIKSFVGDTLSFYRSTDSIDFSKPREFRVLNTDGSKYRSYQVNLVAHQVPTNKIRWKEMPKESYPAAKKGSVDWEKAVKDAGLAKFIGEGIFEAYAFRADGQIMVSTDNGITWKEDQMDEDKSLAPFQEFRFLSIPFAVDADADYQLLIGKSGTEEHRVTDAMTVWRKIAEYDDSHRPSKWVLMPLEEYNRYYLPLNEKYSLLSFNNEILAVSNKGTRVTRDGGITWKMAKRYELPYDDLEEIVATTDDEDYIWIKELESGSVWRGTYVKE